MKGTHNLVFVHEKFIHYGGAEIVFEELVQAFYSKNKLLVYTLFWDKNFKFLRYPDIIEKIEIKEILQSPISKWIVKQAYFVKNPFIRGIFQFVMLPLMPVWFASVKFPPTTKVVFVDSLGLETCVLPPAGAVMVAYVHTPLHVIWNLTSTFFANKNKLKQLLRKILNKVYFAPLRRVNKQAFKRVHVLIANSKEVAARIQRLMGLSAQVINPPVNLAQVKKYACLPKKDYYVFLNRLEPYKQIMELIRIFPQDKKLVVMGKGSLLEPAKKLAQKLKKQIKFLGYVSEDVKYKTLAQAKALIYPNLEDFGIVMVEALAVGTYVIGNTQGGAAEIVKHKKTGFLIESIEDLKNGIHWIEQQLKDLNVKAECKKLQSEALRFDSKAFRSKIRKVVRDAVAKAKVVGR